MNTTRLIAVIAGAWCAVWADAAGRVWHVTLGAPSHPYPLVQAIDAEHAWPADAIPVKPRVTLGASNAVIEIALAPGEHLVGAGGWNIRGTRRAAWCRDSYEQLDTAYFALPFVVSSRDYGLFINCSGRVVLDCGAGQPDTLRILVPEPGVDAYIFRGRPHQIAASYSALVGRPQHVPAWVFTPWFSRNSYMSAKEIDAVVAEGRARGLRPGVVVLECWAESLQSFTFETDRFPNPAAWIADMHTQGVHVVLWETPSIWTNCPPYAVAASNNYLVRNADGRELVVDWIEGGRLVDFRQPAARRWWQALHRPLIAMGVDGFKTDGGERMPAPFFHNLQPYYYQKAVLDAFAASGREGITFARSASPPCAGLSTFWAGDQAAQWQYLPALIRAGLGAAVAGFPFWGHDIGGYSGTPSQELYVRWLQFGTFAPIMQLHGITPREPWHFGAHAESIARTCFQVRERLLPYLVATASNIYSHGIPIMRPMAWVYPQHEEAWAVNDAYLLGDALLVAPVVTPVPREPIPAALLRTPDGSPGLQCAFFANTACAGKPAAVEQMPQVDCNWGQGSAWDPQITDRFSARWQGTLGPIPTAGVYTIIVACDDGARLWVDDKLVIDEWQDRPLGEYAVQLEFSQGQRCPVRLEYYEQSGDAVCRLLWREPGQDRVARSVWLPPGTWVDAWTGDRHAGPGRITRMTPLEEIPVYIRAPRYDALRDIFVTADHHKREPSHD